jgi:pimeloyl-ACP methyl ester carboxylesterase
MHTLAAEELTVDLDGTEVAYYAAGPSDGRPIVLVHGGGIDSAAVSWKETFPALADSYRVYALDLPGYGKSDPVPADAVPDVAYYVDVLGRFYEELNPLETTLVGISMGGAVALGYTLDTPARVSRLVLVDSYGLGEEIPGGTLGAALVRVPFLLEATWWAMRRSRRLTRRALRAVVHPDNFEEELLEEGYSELQRPHAADAYRRFQRAEVGWGGLRTNYADRMDELPVPTLFVHGEDDPLVPADWAKRASDAAPVADRFFLTDCGHWPPRECPEAFVARLEAWLERN